MDIMEKRHELHGISIVGEWEEYEVYVNTEDNGKLPHVHCRLKNDRDKYQTCISLLEANYFPHDGNKDVFNHKQQKGFQNFMEAPVTIPRYRRKFDNNWELACCVWDFNNPDAVMPDNTVMPNYGDLPSK